MKRIPSVGIVGLVALREAASNEYQDIISMVRRATHAKMEALHGDHYFPVSAIYSDRVIVEFDGRYYSFDYVLADNNEVVIGAQNEVTREFKPVLMREAKGAFVEALAAENDGKKGIKWRIRVIKSGLSLNNVFYSDAVLRESAPLFDGCRVLIKSDAEHIAGGGKDVRNIIGKLSNIEFIEGAKANKGGLFADFDLLESAGDMPARLVEAHNRGMSDLYGFSIDADGRATKRGGVQRATKITQVKSVDLIVEPGAGGQIVALKEAVAAEEHSEMKLREQMLIHLREANGGQLPDGLSAESDEGAILTAYRESIASADAGTGAGAGADSQEPVVGITQAQLEEHTRMVESRMNMRAKVAASGLPDAAKQRLLSRFEQMASFKEAFIDTEILGERDYIAGFGGGGQVAGQGAASFVEAGESQSEKVEKMFDAFFDPDDRSVTSFKECYVQMTGDARVTGDLRNCDPARLREAAPVALREAVGAATFANVLGDSMARRMLADYNTEGQYDIWRQLANVVPLSDFRTQERTRMGGYGDLPTVVESANYAALTTPGDEKATYSAMKKGGLETISLEAIRNDDVGAIQRLPIKMARSAKRTLSKFALDFLATNPLIYDTTNLFTVAHANLGAVALSAASLAARRLAMLQQTEAGSGERLGIGARNLWVPADLEQVAVDLFNRGTENDKTFLQSLSLNVIPVWYWTDPNNWCLSADKMDLPSVEIGFLDGNEEPEIFVQDSPTQGSLFSNDQVSYKIRHIYGGSVTDYRGLDGSIVA